jgi:hypothetical protein
VLEKILLLPMLPYLTDECIPKIRSMALRLEDLKIEQSIEKFETLTFS